MEELLRQADLLQGLPDEDVERISAIATTQNLSSGDYLFLLGDDAVRLYVLVKGRVDLCFPMSLGETLNDVSVEVVSPGQTMGWSALVKPYRFTLSARASGPTQVVSFARTDLLEFFNASPRIGYAVLTRISELVGVRLLTVQALWARGLQRAVASDKANDTE